MKTNFGFKLLTGILVAASAAGANAQHTQITVSGIRSDKGQVIVSLFKDEASYEDEKPFKKIPFDKKAIKNGTLVVNYKLDPGTYGITLLDDENKNGEMEKNVIGIPKEGFGFSNFFMEKKKKPAFSDFKTNIKGEGDKVQIKVKYM